MTAAARHEPQAAAAQPQERKPPLLDRILESTKTQERVVPFLRQGDTDYARVAAAVRLYAQMHPDILGCTPASIQAAIIKVAQWGLEIGETAHLVPYNVNVAPKGAPKKYEKQLTPIAGYNGLIQLMVATTVIRGVERPQLVYANEEFKITLGSYKSLTHTPIDDRKARGDIKGVYVFYRMKFGVRDWEYMPIEDVEEIRQKYSKQWNEGPMPAWYPRKTIIRQLAKYIPRDPRLAKVLAVIGEDERAEFGGELDEVIAETHRRSAEPSSDLLDEAADMEHGAPPVTEMGPEWQDDTGLPE